ncbi:MAG TPA: hypothetical protein VHG08_12785 [Longimicrobium sp.]|nr:hypothetical protein [Longimicrobium sp.]
MMEGPADCHGLGKSRALKNDFNDVVDRLEDTGAVRLGGGRRVGHICSIGWAQVYLPRPITASFLPTLHDAVALLESDTAKGSEPRLIRHR